MEKQSDRSEKDAQKIHLKIILEGTTLAFDAELAQAVNHSPEITGPAGQCYQRPLILGMWCAFTNFPWGRGLVNFAPQEEALAMAAYHTWARLFELERFYSWVVGEIAAWLKQTGGLHMEG